MTGCGACGAVLSPGAVFCTNCGTRVPPGGWEGLDELTHTLSSPGLSTGPIAPPTAAQRHASSAAPPMAVSVDTDTKQLPFEPEELVPRMWWVLTPDGTRTDVVLPVVLGRKPRQLPDADGARLVAIADTEGTVSRNHALIEPSQPAVSVTNLSSKNSIGVEWPDGLRYSIRPGQSLVITTHCVLRLGDAKVLLQHA